MTFSQISKITKISDLYQVFSIFIPYVIFNRSNFIVYTNRTIVYVFKHVVLHGLVFDLFRHHILLCLLAFGYMIWYIIYYNISSDNS